MNPFVVTETAATVDVCVELTAGSPETQIQLTLDPSPDIRADTGNTASSGKFKTNFKSRIS